MTVSQIMDLVLTSASVALVITVAVYAKYKITIDKKAQTGNLMARAEQVVARAVEPLVYQAEKEGGTGDEKFTQVLNSILMILDLAHLPHPTAQYLHGEIEKSVTAMKQAQGLIDAVDGASKPERKNVVTTETTVNKEQ